jgi:hypothetical protein
MTGPCKRNFEMERRRAEQQARRRFEQETWGLEVEQRRAASCLSADTLDLLSTTARNDGLEVGSR